MFRIGKQKTGEAADMAAILNASDLQIGMTLKKAGDKTVGATGGSATGRRFPAPSPAGQR
jgi:hypothetical protein